MESAPAERLEGPRVVLDAVGPEHVSGLRRLREHPLVHRWWRELEPGWPLEEPDGTGYAVLLRDGDGTPRGFVQYAEELTPDYRHAGIDVLLDPELHGQGYGREVVGLLAAHLVDDRGHHRLVIDPAAANTAAIACYRSVGFRPVGLMRKYERDLDGSWHDGLLMDLLAEDLVRPGASALTPP